ncbi:NAD(P)/FAD-dependent oxidoreductase [Chitinophaga sp. HK235]|uniref:NAD(P)/FAD-dependent oxidoreductase n=1 Tax=Chitinophaga sp. HK235 TaxID=2952571 RepID=UPI001BAD2AAF|nr:NAD(P)/FAD-dependent oxidoreductase [Chitinophaga sp. HK235]
MKNNNHFDVIIVGGSYSGLAAGMALGRALKQVLIIDSGKPCNQQTPHSHNFLTHDGNTPAEIATLARNQVQQYDTVQFFNGLAIKGVKTETGFEIAVTTGETFQTKKLIFATGIHDIMPGLQGFEACWGISVLHCPYCHGYEVRHQKTGIYGNGDSAFELAAMLYNWTKDLTLFTNGPSTLTADQIQKLEQHQIKVVEKTIVQLEHRDGYLQHILFSDGSSIPLKVLYARPAFEQHCPIPQALGCALTEEGYIQTDISHETTIRGVFACGDNTSRMRTVANAVAMGTTAGIMASKQIISEEF